MFETIRIFLYNNIALHPWGSHLIAALFATLFSLHVPALWAKAPLPERFDNREIANALLIAPIVPQEAQDLTNNFLDHTLPRLLTDDDRLARQLGFADSMNNTVTLDRTLPLILIRRNNVFDLMAGKLKPIELVNNTNNWMNGQGGSLIPRRIVFLLKVNNSTSEAGPISWSSVTMEKSREGPWRIIQVGAPKLSRAMSDALAESEAPQAIHFLLWVPDLNRHYLGEIRAGGDDPANPSIILTALFKDSLTNRSARERFDASSKEFIERLLWLYEELDLPQKLRGRNGQKQPPIKAK